MNFFIHTIMQDTPVTTVLPNEASHFATKCHIFRLAKLNAFTALISKNIIGTFFKCKVSLRDY